MCIKDMYLLSRPQLPNARLFFKAIYLGPAAIVIIIIIQLGFVCVWGLYVKNGTLHVCVYLGVLGWRGYPCARRFDFDDLHLMENLPYMATSPFKVIGDTVDLKRASGRFVTHSIGHHRTGLQLFFFLTFSDCLITHFG